ncbi:alpha/beta fold hydrolase, partial [Bosea sp. CER48]|uniref:alpha/beta fold hydrolase n=1 Tax=Bosea sp. CER48 TaxID=3377035 RepID=UPI00381BD233
TRKAPGDRQWMSRAITRNDTGVHFNGPGNEHGRFDFREALGGISCPVLVMAGDRDPITPIAFSEEIAASLPPERVELRRFADCGHGIVADDREGALQAIRDFILD